MASNSGPDAALGADASGPLFYQTLGFFKNRRLRRILELSGFDLRPGLPPVGGQVAVWGRTRYADRGLKIAARRQANVVSFEDAFLRSVLTGRAGAPPMGLMIDWTGIYFDASTPSDLENLLNHDDLSDARLLDRAADGIAFLRAHHLSKYNATDPRIDPPGEDYVLVIDQTEGDASIAMGGADHQTFQTMLATARRDHPGAKIVIKTHPETASRYRRGHFSRADLDENTTLFAAPISPWRLFENARAVYTVSSLMGFEAILAGHVPKVFGQPFYAGWGLSDDRQIVARRSRSLTKEQIFAGAMLKAPTWYDPFRDCLTSFETAAENMEAEARAWREDRPGYAALGIRRWKRPHMKRFLSASGHRLTFEAEVARAARSRRRGLVWAGKVTDQIASAFDAENAPLIRIEDGFLRSNGLGADLVPPVSLVLDDLGIYYDPARESRLERILNGPALRPAEIARAERLIASLKALGISKYNLPVAASHLKTAQNQKVILVPGQVEDDQSILKAAGDIRTNAALLREVRRRNPEAYLVYKPHPDVEAGLRKGRFDAADLADLVLTNSDPIAAIEQADEVWTMTSLLGFEALLRGKKVSCFGAPFYAGWGLTTDLGPVVERRKARPDLATLVHGSLIAYPRYFDPLTGSACPVEVAVTRLSAGVATGGPRWLAKLQGFAAPLAGLWR